MEKPEKEKLKKSNVLSGQMNTLEVEELSAEALRVLLSDLSSQGFNEKINLESPLSADTKNNAKTNQASGDKSENVKRNEETPSSKDKVRETQKKTWKTPRVK